MAPAGRRTSGSLDRFLFEQGHTFDFYQAVRVLELLYPDRAPVGEGVYPEAEPVRFSSQVSLSFPSAEIEAVKEVPHGIPARMRVNFMSLAGATGPLPLPYAELILKQAWKVGPHKDTAFKDFLDIFNHRLISLMYRVAHTQRIDFPPLHRGKLSLERSRFARALFALMGLGTPGLQNRMRVQDRALLFYTGILAQKPRSLAGLEAILSDYFKVAVQGRSFVGAWYDLDDAQHSRLGAQGQNRALGHDTVAGTRIWDQQGKFELVLGPMPLKQLLDFLPPPPEAPDTRTGFIPLCQITRFYVGRELGFDFLLILDRRESVKLKLGTENGPRLGWTAWLPVGKSRAGYRAVRLSGNHQEESA